MADLKPTPGEALLIWRRRRGLDQFDTAKELGVPVDRVRSWEADRLATKPPQRNLGKLKTYEVCFLLRRRAKVKQRELAVRLGVSRLWVMQMEAGQAPVDRLADYWKVEA